MPRPHAYVTLPPEDKIWIEQEIKRIRMIDQSSKKMRPLQALWLSNKKYMYKAISLHLNVSYRTVTRWIRRYRKAGLGAFIKQQKL